MKEKKEINIQIGKRIRQSREYSRLTQEVLAEKIDVSVQYISDLERGVVGASIPTIIAICKTLDISSDYLLLGQSSFKELPPHLDEYRALPEPQLDLLLRGTDILIEAIKYIP